MWAEKCTIMQEASGSSTAPDAVDEPVAMPEPPLLIILSIACKYEAHGNFFSPLFVDKTSQGGMICQCPLVFNDVWRCDTPVSTAHLDCQET